MDLMVFGGKYGCVMYLGWVFGWSWMVFGWLRIDFDGLGSMFGLFLDGLFDVVGKTFDEEFDA